VRDFILPLLNSYGLPARHMGVLSAERQPTVVETTRIATATTSSDNVSTSNASPTPQVLEPQTTIRSLNSTSSRQSERTTLNEPYRALIQHL
jgi:hypothetical protein